MGRTCADVEAYLIPSSNIPGFGDNIFVGNTFCSVHGANVRFI